VRSPLPSPPPLASLFAFGLGYPEGPSSASPVVSLSFQPFSPSFAEDGGCPPPPGSIGKFITLMKKKSTLRSSSIRNDYRCSIEKNQSGKYCVRIRVLYPRHAWTLPVFFLASSFDRAMKQLEGSLDFLQRNEEKLWFWGVDRAEDIGFSAEFLKEASLHLDRRDEFPRKAANLSVEPEREVPAFVLGPVRRGLAEAIEFARVQAVGD